MTATDVTAPERIVWHDLECGTYDADLRLWHELAAGAHTPVLDIGAGTGRVALALARSGVEVIAVDHDAALLDELRRRADGLPVRTCVADARTLTLAETQLDLALVPMQTIQLLDRDGRAALLARARAHLRPGGLLALAIASSDLEPFADDGVLPAPDEVRLGDTTYRSQPTAVRFVDERVALERRREILRDGAPPTGREDLVWLYRLTARGLAGEATAAGWRALAPRAIPPTAEHVGSVVVMLRA